MNPLKFATNIAEKLGLTNTPDGRQVAQAKRDVGLASQRTAHRLGLQGRKAGEQPTGYGRSIRRARERDQLKSRAKARANATRTQRERAVFYDTAGPLADIYLNGMVDGKPARPETINHVTERVHGQARAMAAAEPGLTNEAALKTIEGHLLNNLDRYREQLREREATELKYRLATRRGQAAVNQRFDHATGHPVVG